MPTPLFHFPVKSHKGTISLMPLGGVSQKPSKYAKICDVIYRQPLLLYFQVKSHIRAISLSASGDLLDQTNWPDTIGSTQEQNHSNAGSAKDALPGNQGSISSTYLLEAFTPVGPQSVRTRSSCHYLFTLLESTRVKAVEWTWMKLSPGLGYKPMKFTHVFL